MAATGEELADLEAGDDTSPVLGDKSLYAFSCVATALSLVLALCSAVQVRRHAESAAASSTGALVRGHRAAAKPTGGRGAARLGTRSRGAPYAVRGPSSHRRRTATALAYKRAAALALVFAFAACRTINGGAHVVRGYVAMPDLLKHVLFIFPLGFLFSSYSLVIYFWLKILGSLKRHLPRWVISLFAVSNVVVYSGLCASVLVQNELHHTESEFRAIGWTNITLATAFLAGVVVFATFGRSVYVAVRGPAAAGGHAGGRVHRVFLGVLRAAAVRGRVSCDDWDVRGARRRVHDAGRDRVDVAAVPDTAPGGAGARAMAWRSHLRVLCHQRSDAWAGAGAGAPSLAGRCREGGASRRWRWR